MKLCVAIICVFLVVVSAQDPIADHEEDEETLDLGTALISAVINSDTIQNKFTRIFELLDLKIRFIKFVKSLLTTENFILLRRFLEVVARASNFIASFLPAPPEDPKSSFLQAILPVLPVIPVNNADHPSEVPRYNRETNFTQEDHELFEKHKDDVVHVAELIYNAP